MVYDDNFRWSEYEEALLADYLFDSNLSAREIANILGTSELDVKRKTRELGLSWVRRRNGYASRGQAALTGIMKKLLPGERINVEEPIGERLRLDVYCPKYKLAAEYHGRQHFYYVEHFHGNMEGFRESRARDIRKADLCQELGIALVVFRYNDDLSEDVVYERLLEGLRGTEYKDESKTVYKRSLKDHPQYDAHMQRQREYRREAYRRMKKRGR